jgi:hypothetical protein
MLLSSKPSKNIDMIGMYTITYPERKLFVASVQNGVVLRLNNEFIFDTIAGIEVFAEKGFAQSFVGTSGLTSISS